VKKSNFDLERLQSAEKLKENKNFTPCHANCLKILQKSSKKLFKPISGPIFFIFVSILFALN